MPDRQVSAGDDGVKIELEKSARDALARGLARYLKDEFDVEVGGMEAVLLLDFISERLGPHYYNQALCDAHAHLHARMEALGEAFFELERPAKF
jgi:uncharacterized protein (DUF2164 family)